MARKTYNPCAVEFGVCIVALLCMWTLAAPNGRRPFTNRITRQAQHGYTSGGLPGTLVETPVARLHYRRRKMPCNNTCLMGEICGDRYLGTLQPPCASHLEGAAPSASTNTGNPKLSAPVCIECGLVFICNAVRGSGNCIAARSQLRASA